MASGGFDPAPTWQVDELVKRVNKLEKDARGAEKERWEEKNRRFRIWAYCCLAVIWLASAASVVLSIVHAATH